MGDLPFTTTEFFNVMRSYNLTIWPAQILLNLLAFTIIVYVFTTNNYSGKIISLILSFLWIWTGGIYHLIFFTEINPAAFGFGIIFLIQGLLFLIWGVFRDELIFSYKGKLIELLGGLFIFYSLVVYPLLSSAFGHQYPDNPTFGLPCPGTIFTFGVLLFAKTKIPWYLILIPLIWSIIGFSAAINFGVYEDAGLLFAGVSGFIAILTNNKSLKAVIKISS